MGQRSEFSSSSRPIEPLKGQQSSEDRISQLPDDILIYVLSFLSVKDAVQTSVLSVRWKSFWKHTPLLHFDSTDSIMHKIFHDRKLLETEKCKFINWVNHVLEEHKGPTLDEFRVFFNLDGFSKDEIDKWLEHVLARQIQKLELNFLCLQKLTPIFPYSLTDHCGVRRPASVCVKSLKVLTLKGVDVTSEVVEFFLLNCPFLERLEVVGSEKLGNLVVSGPSLKLKHLEITYCVNIKSIIISNSNIVSLKLSKLRNVTVDNLPMLKEVGIHSVPLGFPSEIFDKFAFCLSQLEVLALCTYKPERTMDFKEYPKLRNVRQLVLTVLATSGQSLMGLTSLIQLFPNLQKFVLTLQKSLFEPPYIFDRAVRCPLECLKVIEVSGYSGEFFQDELILYLARNAVVLEKITIDTVDPIYSFEETSEQKAARCHAVQWIGERLAPHVELKIL